MYTGTHSEENNASKREPALANFDEPLSGRPDEINLTDGSVRASDYVRFFGTRTIEFLINKKYIFFCLFFGCSVLIFSQRARRTAS